MGNGTKLNIVLGIYKLISPSYDIRNAYIQYLVKHGISYTTKNDKYTIGVGYKNHKIIP